MRPIFRDLCRSAVVASALLSTLMVRSASAAEATASVNVSAPSELPPDPKAPKPAGPRAKWHPAYGAEIEPHFIIAGFDKYGPGLGAGLNVTVPIWHNAPFKSFDNDIGFGIGLDWVRYAGYNPVEPKRGSNVLTYAIYVPVYVQWNLWLGSRASLFVEPTLLFRFADYPDNCPQFNCTDTTRVLPTGSVGLRFRVIDRISATIRVGWPLVTIGASWL